MNAQLPLFDVPAAAPHPIYGGNPPCRRDSDTSRLVETGCVLVCNWPSLRRHGGVA